MQEILELDDNTLHALFLFLDGTSLLRVSECCQRFKDIFSSSLKLLNNVNVKVNFPDNQVDQASRLQALKERIKGHHQLTRRYQRLELTRLRDEYLSGSDQNYSDFTSLIKKLAQSVRFLNIVNTHILRTDLIDLLLPFKHLQECSLSSLMFFDDVVPADTDDEILCPNLKSLQLSQCDFFCLLLFKSCKNLTTLEISDPSYVRTDVEELENFLLKQKGLKELRLINFRFNSTYSSNRLAKVPFQLDSLVLKNAHWDITDHCVQFLTSQRSLKKLELRAFRKWISPFAPNYLWFSSVMTHFFANNHQLTSVAFDTMCTPLKTLSNVEFLPGVVNKTVVELEYVKGMDDESELLKSFSRIFPNVRRLRFRDCTSDSVSALQQVQNFPALESLDLKLDPKFLLDFRIASRGLQSFSFCASNESKSADKLTDIFAQNSSMRDLSLNIEPLTFEEITEITIPLAATLETLSISDLHLNPTEAELLTCNFPKLRTLRSDRRLNRDIVGILRQGNIHFEYVEDNFNGDDNDCV